MWHVLFGRECILFEKWLYEIALNLGNTGGQMFGLITYLSHVEVIIKNKYLKKTKGLFA